MRRLYTMVAAAAIAVDQVTKALARARLPGDREVAFVGKIWRWSLSFNTGTAFSMFTGAGAILTVLACACAVAVTVRVFRERAWRPIFAVGMALVAGGAVGNAIDRIAAGRVTDFVRWGSWPVFNVADALLLVGVGLLLVEPRRARPAVVA